MAVISITIIESAEQIMAGIPKTIGITTNVPTTIFYTLDGTSPTLFSTMYTGLIFLPTDKLSIILNILATNGVDTSPIVSETFITNMLNDARLAHSATDTPAGELMPSLYPFGTPPVQPMGIYLNPGDAGVTVDNPALAEIPSGFDGYDIPTGFTNQPYNIENYNIVYSTTDFEGQTGIGVGNLPATAKIQTETAAPEETEQFNNLFDPRAFVIFQDSTKEDPNEPPHINRMHFSLENPERARDGNNFFTSGLDAPPVSGTFLRSHYNPRTNMITYYYLDTWTNRWIISTTPYNPNGTWDGNLAGVAGAGGGAGGKYVFEWLPFTRRVLF